MSPLPDRSETNAPAPSPAAAAPRGAWRRGWLIAALLFLAGAALRVRGVDSLSIVGDEIYTIWETRSARAAAGTSSMCDAWQTRLALAVTDEPLDAPGVEPRAAWRLRWAYRTNPLHLMLNEATFELFGESPLVARLVPLIFGLLALIVLPLQMRRLAGDRAALLLLALLALCPDHVLLSKLARYQSACFFFGGVAALAAANFARARRPRDELLSLAASVLLVASHLTGVLVATTLLIHLALLLRGRVARIVLPLAAAGAVALLTWGSLSRVVETIHAGVTRRRFVTPWWKLAASLLYNVGPAVAALAAWALARARKAALTGIAPLVLSMVVPACVLLVTAQLKDVGARYFAAISACAVVLAALGAEALFRMERTRRFALPAVALALLSQAPLLASDWIDGQRYDYAGAGARLQQLAQPGDLIVSDWGGIVDDYLKGHPPVAELPPTVTTLDSRLRAAPTDRAFILFARQRDAWVWPGNSVLLGEWLALHARRVATLGRERFDRRLYHFELELYEVDVAALRQSTLR